MTNATTTRTNGRSAQRVSRKITRTPGASLALLFDTTTRRAVRDVLAVYDAADDNARAAGALWYPSARRHALALAAHGDIPVGTAAAVIAHLSPRTSWTRNLRGAYALVSDRSLETPAGCMRANVRGALRALEAPDGPAAVRTLNGPKVQAFCRNILGDMRYVTVDTWAVRIAVPDMDKALAESRLARVGGYDAIAHVYRLAAARRGVSPAVMQATTWVAHRGVHRHESDTAATDVLASGALLIKRNH